jgi:hypothetical protein
MKAFPAEYGLDNNLQLKRSCGAAPPPLDVALLSSFHEIRLSLADRASALGLLELGRTLNRRMLLLGLLYDKISAESLSCHCRSFYDYVSGVVSPLLHVLPMTPGYDCSAAAALSCFHVFAHYSCGSF